MPSSPRRAAVQRTNSLFFRPRLSRIQLHLNPRLETIHGAARPAGRRDPPGTRCVDARPESPGQPFIALRKRTAGTPTPPRSREAAGVLGPRAPVGGGELKGGIDQAVPFSYSHDKDRPELASSVGGTIALQPKAQPFRAGRRSETL